jgi:FlaA1/EpsC-like NDP-sugar epimerase
MNNFHLGIDYNKLLGRDPISTSTKSIESFIKGKRILVTGGCGSIGSEIVRQLVKFKASSIIVYDNAESPLFYLEQEILKLNKNLHIRYIIGDVKDLERLDEIFESFKPNVVYHAAAYKHVLMMEGNPIEAIKTNVLGTKNVADTACFHGVETFVMVSTDKAVNPTNIMGATKRIAEIYTQFLNKNYSTSFITTRFGNVLGSQGSVVPTFVGQILDGGPVLVTHSDVIRYFMTIHEACQLVLQASSLGEGGEIFLFDMGNPVKIYDLAENLIKMLGKTNVEIKIIGLRPGEKLYEELLCSGENSIPTDDPNIMKLKHTEIDFNKVMPDIERLTKLKQNDFYKIISLVKNIVPEFKRESVIN